MSISDLTDKAKSEIKDMIKEGVTSFKLYTTYDIKLDDDDLLSAMEEIAKQGGIVGVHCENDGIISELRANVKGDDNKKVISHALTRPAEAEADCVNRLAYMSHITGAAFLAVHITCEEALNEVKIAKEKGYNVYGETCPQYLFFDDSVYKKKFVGSKIGTLNADKKRYNESLMFLNKCINALCEIARKEAGDKKIIVVDKEVVKSDLIKERDKQLKDIYVMSQIQANNRGMGYERK